MNENRVRRNNMLGDKMVKALNGRNIEAFYVESKEAAPINAQRFNIDTPCKKTGVCFDCQSPQSICCQFLVTRRSMHAGIIKVILVNDNLGF